MLAKMQKWWKIEKFLILIALAITAYTYGLNNSYAESLNQSLSCTPPAAEPEIVELARALNYELAPIYEFVYFNIEYSPTFGLKKSALGTYLDRSGNNMDQNKLFVELLRQSCIEANYRYGDIIFPAAAVANLYSVDNDVDLLSNALGNSGIPACIRVTAGGSCVITGGVAATVQMTRVWTEVIVNGNPYGFDPSYKSHQAFALINILAAMGYDKTAFLNDASTGSSVVPGMPSGVTSIKNVNKENIAENLNTYSANLANYIRTNNPTSSTDEIVGGNKITTANYAASFPLTGAKCAELGQCTVSPNVLETSYTLKVSDSGTSYTINKTYYASEIDGKRITLQYNSSNQPVLYIDGQIVATGIATSATYQILTLQLSAPYEPFYSSYSTNSRLKRGGTYSILLSAGQVGRGKLTQIQQDLGQALEEGLPNSSERVIGNSVARVGAAYLSQTSATQKISGDMNNASIFNHFTLGIAGYDGSGAMVDVPGLLTSKYPKNVNVTLDDQLGLFYSQLIRASVLESAVVKQFQEAEAVSTARMFDISNSDGIGFVLATPANWVSVKPKLVNWAPADITDMQTFLTAGGAGTRQAIIPINGDKTVNQWKGNGYYLQRQNSADASGEMIAKITGTLKGGYQTTITDMLNNWLVEVISTAVNWYRVWESQDPIDMKSGYFTVNNDDISVGTDEFPYGLTLTRGYVSGNKNIKTELGYGWRHNYMNSIYIDSDPYVAFGQFNPLAAVSTIAALQVMKDLETNSSSVPLVNTVVSSLSASWLMDQLVNNAVTVESLDGTRKFIKIPTASGGNEYVPPPGDHYTLTQLTSGETSLTSKIGETTIYDVDGKIKSWSDSNNNVVDFEYIGTGPSKLLDSVNNNKGRQLSFDYNSVNQLISVTDGVRTVEYTYDTNGNLSSYKNTLNQSTIYNYVSTGLINKVYYPQNPSVAVLTNTYDSENRVTTQADTYGNLWHYLFAGNIRNIEVNPLGDTRVFLYDENGYLTALKDQEGSTTTYLYDGVGRRVLETGNFGNTVAYTYDNKANILSRTLNPVPGAIDPLTGLAATPIVESWTYTSLSKPATYTDGNGNVTNYSYDTGGNLLTTTKPPVEKPGVPGTASPVTTITYNSFGQPLIRTDPEGRTTTYEYYPTTQDLHRVILDAGGSGHLNLITEYTYDTVGNNTHVKDQNGNVQSFEYDAERRVTKVTAPYPLDSTVTEYRYDANGNRTEVREATNNPSNPWRIVVTAYNEASKPILVTNPDGSTLTTAYDILGRVFTVTSSSGRVTRTEYDPVSRVSKITDEVTGVLDPSITENLGTVIREQRTYFLGGLIKTLVDGNSNVITHAYDGFLRIAQIQYQNPNSTPDYDYLVYDKASNLRVHQRRDGSQVWLTYDSLNRVKTKSPSGQPTTTYGYDYADNFLTITSSAGGTTGVGYTYDAAGRIQSEISSLFGTTQLSRDDNGNVVQLTPPSSVSSAPTSFTYDSLNRVTNVYDGTVSAGTLVANLNYDVLGRTHSILFNSISSPVASTAISYSPNNKPDQITHIWNGSSLTLDYLYNEDHQVKSATFSDSSFVISGLPSNSSTYVSNSLNQYSSISGSPLIYDGKGNLTGDGSWVLTYNTENQLVTATNGSVTVNNLYDVLGRRQWKQVTSGGVTTSYAYYSVGDSELAEFSGSGTVYVDKRFLYAQGDDDHIAVIDEPSGSLQYIFKDALGSIIALTNDVGTLSEIQTYSPYGLNKSLLANTSSFRFASRRYDSEIGLYYSRARFYSPLLGRFIQPDPSGTDDGLNIYAYVKNDPLNRVDPTGRYGEIINTYVPGVYYESLSDQAFENGDYIWGAGYYAAALVESAISAYSVAYGVAATAVTKGIDLAPTTWLNEAPQLSTRYANYKIDINANDFISTLVSNGYRARIDKGNTILTKDDIAYYTVYAGRKSEDFALPGAAYNPGGGVTIKYTLTGKP